LTISGFHGVKSWIPCIRIHDITKSKVPMEWKAIERSNPASASECRQIGFRESRERVAWHRDYRNHDKEKFELARRKGQLLIVFAFQILRYNTLEHRIRGSEKSDLPKYKGEFLRVNCGWRFPEREIEERLLRALWDKERRTTLCT